MRDCFSFFLFLPVPFCFFFLCLLIPGHARQRAGTATRLAQRRTPTWHAQSGARARVLVAGRAGAPFHLVRSDCTERIYYHEQGSPRASPVMRPPEKTDRDPLPWEIFGDARST